MELSIVIVSYNASKLLETCLHHVFKALSFAKFKKTEVIVVDNASSDDSVRLVKNRFPSVYLICNKKNVGFAKGNNQGIKKSHGRYILLLNSDTKISQDALVSAVSEAEKDEKIAVVGGRLLNTDDSIQQSVGFFPTLLKVFFWMSFLDDIGPISDLIKPYHVTNRGFYKKSQEVDWVSGAFMLVRRDAIAKVGLLDEKIFMYGEEVEWCYRIKKVGYKIYYYPSVSVYHYKGGSGAGEYSGIVEEFTSLLYFYKKHMKARQRQILTKILFFGALLRLLLFGIIMGNSKKAALYEKTLKMVG
jgi:hypothetical protein